MRVPRETDADQPDNPAWPKADHRARTELCTWGGNELREAKGMAEDRP